MSHVRIVSIGLMGLALSTLAAAGPQAPTTQPSREQVLEAKIRAQDSLIIQLDSELKASQKQAADLNYKLHDLQQMLAAFMQVRPAPQPKTIPPDWNQRQFNGVPVYLLPCETPSGTPATPARAASK